MSDPDPPSLEALELAAEAKRPWWRRRWATIGEVVGVCALLIAGLGYWDAHRERGQEAARRTAEARREQARAALVLTGEAQADGSRITLSTLGSGQAVQSQRYLFPKTVLGHAMEVSAARPQIALGWFEGGLKTALDPLPGLKTGEGVLPVGVVTRYVEDGEAREDRSLYRVGYAVRKAGLFGGRKITLLGLSLHRRGVAGDLQAAVDAAWRAESARGLAAEAGG
ncbi:hypothetical protein BH09PSE2_BH09PSE2_24860 [soil metagenome]